VLLVTSDQYDNNWGTILSLLHFGGKLVLLALPDKLVPLPASALVLRQKTIVGSITGVALTTDASSASPQ
jgi:D-arabinose 1-dehydrogenase-like Zn-dependent alcohol dehydrogenase